MARRTGIPSLIDVAQTLCRLITKFTPVIVQQYSGNPELLAALSAANVACAALVEEASAVREYGD